MLDAPRTFHGPGVAVLLPRNVRIRVRRVHLTASVLDAVTVSSLQQNRVQGSIGSLADTCSAEDRLAAPAASKCSRSATHTRGSRCALHLSMRSQILTPPELVGLSGAGSGLPPHSPPCRALVYAAKHMRPTVASGAHRAVSTTLHVTVTRPRQQHSRFVPISRCQARRPPRHHRHSQLHHHRHTEPPPRPHP